MNRYLLDTHILLWWLSDDKKLAQKTKELISKPTNHILVSVVSIWEIVIKKSLNKLKAPDNLKEILSRNDFEVLPITVDHALYLEQLPNIHNDPFDRLLIAQAIVDDLILITQDDLVAKYAINRL